MEISLVNREFTVCQTGSQIRKRTQVSAECVVPDSQDDVGRVASVCSDLLLKGKDLSPHGVTVSGEVQAAVLYITEDGQGLSILRFSRPFTMEFETEEPDAEALPQITWSISGTEVRVLNSRKLSLAFEVNAELCPYRKEQFVVENSLPAGDWKKLHVKTREQDARILSCVTEKAFSVHEQFSFPAGKNTDGEHFYAQAALHVLDTEQVGSRAIVKGELCLTVQGLNTEECVPFSTVFHAPFSQLVEVGEGQAELFTVNALPSTVYLDLIDTISGEKAMDAEVHGVLQLCAWKREQVQVIEDAYSNLLPCQCTFENRSLITELTVASTDLTSEERLGVSEDCQDVLTIQPSLGSVESGTEQLTLPVSLDILYRDREGSLIPVRRSLALEGKPLPTGAQILNIWLENCDFRPEGSEITARLTARIVWRRGTTGELSCVKAMTLQEDTPYDPQTWPDLTLVRRQGEELWELAKTYHASVEAIVCCNAPEQELLLIPCER